MTKLETDIATLDKYIGRLRAVRKPTAAQKEKLATYVERRAALKEKHMPSGVAHVSEADRQAIGAAFTKWVLANGRQPEDGDWPAILGPDLLNRAFEGDYFPAGSVPGLDRGGVTAKGFTLQSGTVTDANDNDSRFATLLLYGKEIARRDNTPTLENIDTLAWARSLGYDV